jgi:hypothetical protein
MSSDNDLSNNDVNDDSGNDFEFVHVPNNGLIPATNIGTKDSGADKLRTGYYEPIKNTGYYDSNGYDIGHLFATGGNLDVGYDKGNDSTLKIWQDSNIAGKKHDANSGSAGSSNPLAYEEYFADRGSNYEGEVGPHVQFGGYGAYKWGKNSEGSTGIQSQGASWKIDIPTINTLKFENGIAEEGTQRAKKAVAYIVSSGGSCTGSVRVWRGKYSSSDGSSGAYSKHTFDIGTSETAKLVLERNDGDKAYVTIGNTKHSVKNGEGGAQDRWGSKDGKKNVGKPSGNISNGNFTWYGPNLVNFKDNHPKFNSNTGRGSGNNSDKPGFVGAIQVHFFWD